MDDALRRGAALMGAAVPAKIKKEIIAIAKDEHPKAIAVLALGSMYQARYSKEFRPETYGFKTPNELLSTIPKIDLHYEEMLELWFLKYNPDGEEVGEDGQTASSNGGTHNDQKVGEPVVETNGNKRKTEEEEEAAAPLNASEGKKIKTEVFRVEGEGEEEAPVLLVASDGEEEVEETEAVPIKTEGENKKAVKKTEGENNAVKTDGGERKDKATSSSMVVASEGKKKEAQAVPIKTEGEPKATSSSMVAVDSNGKKKAPAIGIDLGTTYSVVAVNQNKRTEVLSDEFGQKLIPSFVAYTKDGCLVGMAAKNQSGSNPKNTIYDAKRLIGRQLADDAVQAEIGRLPFQVVEAEKRLKIQVSPNGIEKSYLPEQVSAMVLRRMKEVAEVKLGTTVTDAVITVPAYFTDTQRQATKDAARIAGLNVLLILNEPTAAAIAYSLHCGDATRNVLVFDFGGGTLDVTILEIANGSLHVASTAGDMHLGGEDIDNRMVEYFVRLFKEKHGKDISTKPFKLRRLRDACEKAKRDLSYKGVTEASFHFELFEDEELVFTISRVQFEQLNQELFDRILGPVTKALVDKDMTPAQIDDVVLVGGSSRIPKVKELLGGHFGKQKLISRLHADSAVAHGAAIYAAIMNSPPGAKDVEDICLMDVTPFTLGIDTSSGRRSAIIRRNSTIPTSGKRSYTNPKDNAESMTIQVLQGEAEMSVDNVVLGEFELMIPKAKAKTLDVEVTLEISFDGILHVSAVVTSCGAANNITIANTACRLSETDIARMAHQAELINVRDERQRGRLLAKHALEDYLIKLKETFKNGTHYKLASEGGRKLMLVQIEDAIRWTKYASHLAVIEDYEQKREQLDEAYGQFIGGLQGGDEDELPISA